MTQSEFATQSSNTVSTPYLFSARFDAEQHRADDLKQQVSSYFEQFRDRFSAHLFSVGIHSRLADGTSADGDRTFLTIRLEVPHVTGEEEGEFEIAARAAAASLDIQLLVTEKLEHLIAGFARQVSHLREAANQDIVTEAPEFFR